MEERQDAGPDPGGVAGGEQLVAVAGPEDVEVAGAGPALDPGRRHQVADPGQGLVIAAGQAFAGGAAGLQALQLDPSTAAWSASRRSPQPTSACSYLEVRPWSRSGDPLGQFSSSSVVIAPASPKAPRFCSG